MMGAQTTTWEDDPLKLPAKIRSLRTGNEYRIMFDKLLRRLYFDLPTFLPYNAEKPFREWGQFIVFNQTGFNLTRNVIDAAASQVLGKLKISVQPYGADYDLERSCLALGAAIAGIMKAAKYWETLDPLLYREGTISSLGTVLWYLDGSGEIGGESLTSDCILWDADEGREPPHLYIDRAISRVGLISMFPKLKEQILNLPRYTPDTVVGVEYGGGKTGDTVRVSMAWRRKMGNEPGKYVAVAWPDLVLNPEPEKQEWDHSFFPTAHYRHDWDAEGFGGYAGARILVPYHWAQNKLLRDAYDGFEGMKPAVLKNVLEEEEQEFSTKAWREILWRTHKPEVIVPQAVSPLVLQEIDKLESRAFQAFGMNEQAARGTRPAGLNSAPSQREWIEIKNQRLSRPITNRATAATDSARVITALASDAYKNKKIRTLAPGTNLLTEVKWPIDLREDKYQAEFIEASGLSDTMAGRKEQLSEFRDRGSMTEAEYLRALDTPDLKAIADRLGSPADRALQMIEAALHDCIFIMPDNVQGAEGLDALIRLSQLEYQRAQVQDKYPRKNLECLRRLNQAAVARRNGLKASVPVAPVPGSLPGQPASVQPMPSAVLPPAAPAPGAAQVPPQPQP
jgi:hypothetical protein